VSPQALSRLKARSSTRRRLGRLPSLIENWLRNSCAWRATGHRCPEALAVTVVDGRAAGVYHDKRISLVADAVLLATGADVPRMAADSGRYIADGTPIALLVRTKPVDLPLRAVLNTPRVAIRPTPDGALALDSAWSEAEVVVNSDGTYGVKDSTIQGLLDEASKVIEGHPRLELESYGVAPSDPGDGEPSSAVEAHRGILRRLSANSGATLGLMRRTACRPIASASLYNNLRGFVEKP